MYGIMNPNAYPNDNRRGKPLVDNPNHVIILAKIEEPKYKRYIIKANWEGCRNPLTAYKNCITYVDPSIKDYREGRLPGAYYVSERFFSAIFEGHETNKQAAHMLSKEF